MAATDPEAQALGYQLPTGTSLIRDGDDAISNNARVAAGLHITLKNRVDALAADDATDVDSVNGKTGAVTLTAADVGALPDTYIPAWDEISDKPTNFPPTAHAGTHATGGTDPITPASIGAVAASDDRLKDTGWRDISSLSPVRSAGRILVRRIGPVVSVAFVGAAFDVGGTITALPPGTLAGFAPTSVPSSLVAMSTAPHRVTTPSNGQMSIFSYTAGAVLNMSASFLTDVAWPTTLPGIPA